MYLLFTSQINTLQTINKQVMKFKKEITKEKLSSKIIARKEPKLVVKSKKRKNG